MAQQASRSEPKASGAQKAGKTITVRWVKSQIGFDQRQRKTLRGLGFRRLNQRLAVEDTPSVRGMIYKVRHLLQVDEVE